MKNMFSVISGIVNVMGRVRGIEDATGEINSRIQALGGRTRRRWTKRLSA